MLIPGPSWRRSLPAPQATGRRGWRSAGQAAKPHYVSGTGPAPERFSAARATPLRRQMICVPGPPASDSCRVNLVADHAGLSVRRLDRSAIGGNSASTIHVSNSYRLQHFRYRSGRKSSTDKRCLWPIPRLEASIPGGCCSISAGRRRRPSNLARPDHEFRSASETPRQHLRSSSRRVLCRVVDNDRSPPKSARRHSRISRAIGDGRWQTLTPPSPDCESCQLFSSRPSSCGARPRAHHLGGRRFRRECDSGPVFARSPDAPRNFLPAEGA